MKFKKFLGTCIFPSTLLTAFIVTAHSADNKINVENSEAASRPPSVSDLIESTAPGYSTPPGMKSECLGRLMFDLKNEIAWPTWYDSDTGFAFNKSFSRNVFNRSDEIKVGNVTIAVIGPVTQEITNALANALPANELQQQIQQLKKDELRFAANNKVNAQDRKAHYAQSKLEDSIQGTKDRIKELHEKYGIFNPGIPDSEGYWYSKVEPGDDRYSVFRANLKRGAYVYVFESTELLSKKMDKERHRRNFVQFLASFRTRNTNEIPRELGICIPFGFIQDDGNTTLDIKQSLRWVDAPGVLYSIHSGDVEAGRIKHPVVEAAASAAVGMLGSQEEETVKPFVTQRIGPRSSKIGALTAQQGGVVLSVKGKNNSAYEAYSVFTGYSGWLGSSVLPYILIDMSTRTMEQAAELKKNPPPFKQSMERLETLLKSTRLRPTIPLMLELATIPRVLK
jgi:hypothetical protein